MAPTAPTHHSARALLRALGTAALLVACLAVAAGEVDGVSAKDKVKDKKVEAKIQGTTLIVKGSKDDDMVALRLANGDSTILEVDINNNGQADFEFSRSLFDSIVVDADSGDDTIVIDELTGAFTDTEATVLNGEDGNDTLIGGIGGEIITGGPGNDVLLGKAGIDTLLGGDGDDTLTGGDGDDQVFGEAGNDRLVWNPGDDTDLNEGGDGTDTVEVNGGNGSETLTAVANGLRVRFDRVSPAPFFLDIGTSETLIVNANGGDDSFSATGNLAALISLTIDGGAGADTLLGSNGADLLIGGDGDDFIDGQQGNDIALGGDGDDVFQWDPGDGSDTLEGQAGNDTLVVNGSGANEQYELSANGGRVVLSRNVGNVTMDFDDVENVDLKVLGGADAVTVNDLSATDLADIDVDLGALLGGGDAQADAVVLNASGGDDTVDIFGSGTSVTVAGLTPMVTVESAEGANDSLRVNALGGNDGVTAATLPSGIVQLTLDGGSGNDTVLGSAWADVLIGGDGNDVIIGRQGADVAFLGDGDDVFQWNPGDGSDTVEGQAGTDTLVFNGSNANEDIDISANGGRVRLFRNIANVAMDLDDVEQAEFQALGGADNIVVGDLTGTDLVAANVDLRGPGGAAGDAQADSVTVNGTQGDDVFGAAGDGAGIAVVGLHATVNIVGHEQANDRLVLNALGGADSVEATALQAGAIRLTLNGGLGEDVLLGSPGDDLVVGGDGNDVALLGAGDDTFVWNPGDDNDVVEGQAGFDTLLFNSSNVSENIDLSANGARVRLFRDVAGVTMDLNDVESIDWNALGGPDTIVVNDLSGTDLVELNANLAAIGGAGDAQPDTIVVNGTAGDDVILVFGDANGVAVLGLAAQVNITGAESTLDQVIIKSLAGDDVVDGTGLTADAIQFRADGGDGADVLEGGDGNDVLLGGDGDDVLVGGPGIDILDGGSGNNIVIQ